jgi:hypothetical protein
MRTGARLCAGRAGGRGAEQTRKQWIFVADGVVAYEVQLSVPGRGHEGDDPAPLEEAQDALAGTLDHSLDLVLGRSRGRVKQRDAASIAARAVGAVQEERVEVGVQAQITGRALNDGHGAARSVGQAPPGLARAVPRRHGVGEDSQHRAQDLRVERERKPQRVRQRQHPLADRDVLGEHVIHQVGRSLVHAPAQTAGAKPPALAAEGHQMPLMARVAEEVSKASRQDSTRQEPAQLLGHESGQAPAVRRFSPLLLERRQVLLHRMVQRRRLRAATVDLSVRQ